VTDATGSLGNLFIWLDGDPESTTADVIIPDTPGVSDIDQIADAVERGALGRYLPVTIRFADREDPSARRVRSLDTARLLRERSIRHRRRYEVFSGQAADSE
jgi:hypothetical protein